MSVQVANERARLYTGLFALMSARFSLSLVGVVGVLVAVLATAALWLAVSDPVTTATAVDAAAAVHSDLARGFIRAEVVTYDDLIACGSMVEARKRGLLRSEGRTYGVRDGDVIEVLFNVAR